MANAILAFPNFADEDYYEPVYGGGSWLAAMPLTNLQDPLLVNVARSSTDAVADTKLHVDLMVNRDIRVVAIPDHNMSRVAEVKVRATEHIGWEGVQLAASVAGGASSVTVDAPSGSAMIRTGDIFKIAGDDTVYKATSDLSMGANIMSDSEDLSRPPYRGEGSETIVTNATTAPDGATTADLVREDAAGGYHGIYWSETGTLLDTLIVPADLPHCISFFMKPAGRSMIAMWWQDSKFIFDTDAKEVTVYETGDILTPVSYGIEAVDDGWFRCWISQTNIYEDAIFVELMLLDDAGSILSSYTGDGESGAYIWGIQIEQSVSPSTYKRSGVEPASATTSGSVNVTPTITANAADNTALTCHSGDYIAHASAINTGWEEVWQQAYPWGLLPYGHPSWYDGKLTEEDRQGYPMPYIHVTAEPASARYCQIEIDDTTNADTYIDLGRLFIARGFQPTVNLAWGAQHGWETETKTKPSKGGARFYEEYDPRRTISFAINHLPEDEALVFVTEIQRKLGVSGQLFFAFDPDDTYHQHRRSFLATMRQLNASEYVNFGLQNSTFQLEEVIS